MGTMAQVIQERSDAFMRHCVAGVTKGGKDKAAAFAICKAGGNKAGYYQPGTKIKTAKGKQAIRAHARDKAAPGKDAAYERAVKSEGVMSMKALIGQLTEGKSQEIDLAKQAIAKAKVLVGIVGEIGSRSDDLNDRRMGPATVNLEEAIDRFLKEARRWERGEAGNE